MKKKIIATLMILIFFICILSTVERGEVWYNTYSEFVATLNQEYMPTMNFEKLNNSKPVFCTDKISSMSGRNFSIGPNDAIDNEINILNDKLSYIYAKATEGRKNENGDFYYDIYQQAQWIYQQPQGKRWNKVYQDASDFASYRQEFNNKPSIILKLNDNGEITCEIKSGLTKGDKFRKPTKLEIFDENSKSIYNNDNISWDDKYTIDPKSASTIKAKISYEDTGASAKYIDLNSYAVLDGNGSVIDESPNQTFRVFEGSFYYSHRSFTSSELQLSTDVSLQKYIVKVNNTYCNSNDHDERANWKTYDEESNEYLVKNGTWKNITNNKNIKNQGNVVNEFKRDKAVEIEAGDEVTYRVVVYNNSKVTANSILVKDRMPAYTEKGNKKSYTTISKITKGNSTDDIKSYWKEDTNTNNFNTYCYTVTNLPAGKYVYFDITLKFNKYSDNILDNTVWISNTGTQTNKKTYRTIDRDYVQMKKYKVSLEKFVSKVNDVSIHNLKYDVNNDGLVDTKDVDCIINKYSNVMGAYTGKAGTYENGYLYGDINGNGEIDYIDSEMLKHIIRDGKRCNDSLTGKEGKENYNTWKRDNKVELEIGDEVTFTIRLKNTGNTPVKITKFYDSSEYINGNKYLKYIGIEGGHTVSTPTKGGGIERREITLNNPSLIQPDQYIDIKLTYQVIVNEPDETTKVSRKFSNTAGIILNGIKNKNNYVVSDSDGTDNNRDKDYLTTKTYAVSLEKYITQVTDKYGNNVENYTNDKDRSGKRHNESLSDGNINKNSYKKNNKVEVEPNDIVTFTIKLTNTGTTQVKITEIEDSFTSNINGLQLERIGSIQGTYKTAGDYNGILNETYIKFRRATLIEPGDSVYVTIKFKVLVPPEFTKSEQILQNKAVIVSLKNKNNYVVSDSDGTDNNADMDWVKTKTYAVSLEKYISKVNNVSVPDLKYDVNGDGAVDLKDVELINKYIAKQPVNLNGKGDINADGKIDYDDVSALKNIIREGKPEHMYDDDTDTNSDWKKRNVVTVKNGDTVTYTIKVKNDSEKTGVYINKITDTLDSKGFDNRSFNILTAKKYNKSGTELSNILSNVRDVTVNASSNIKTITIDSNNNTFLNYGDYILITVSVKVTEPNISLRTLPNIAEITEMKNRNEVTVEDTTPNNNKDADYIKLDWTSDKPDQAVISGIVWNDIATNKTSDNYDGLYQKSNEQLLSGIKVLLYRYGVDRRIAETTTDSNGYYYFNNDSIDATVVTNSWERYIKGPLVSENDNKWAGTYYSYYVVFEYDGITYTSTFDGNVRIWDINDNAEDKQYSNAQEDGAKVKESRTDFNSRFSTINNTSGIEYTTKNDEGYIPQSNHIYNPKTMTIQSSTNLINLNNFKNSEEKLEHVNLGLRGRDVFDLELTSDVVSTKVTVNGVDGTYNYGNKVTVRRNDLSSMYNVKEDMANVYGAGSQYIGDDYEQKVRKTDIKNDAYKDTGLEIYVTYRITVKNASQTQGAVTKIIDYYDSRYTFEGISGSNSGEDMTVNNKTPENKTPGEVIITKTNNIKDLNQSESIYVDLTFRLNDEAIKELFNLESGKVLPTYNMAEIYEYKTQRSSSQTEYTRGLIDKDSAPGSVATEKVRLASGNSTDTTLGYYFKAQNLQYLKYEDDTYAAPTLIFVSDDSKRTITGTVFEDFTKINSQNVKSGNGVIDDGEPGIYGATIELIENNSTVRYSTTTDKKGEYTFSGFLPGNYIIKYQYGDTEKTVVVTDPNKKSYNGEDFQSTNNSYTVNGIDTNKLSNRDNYWYLDNESRGISAATDNSARRKEVSRKVTDFTDDQMTVLNNLRAKMNKEESKVGDITVENIINDTKMNANTANMLFEVEKPEIKNNKVLQTTEFKDYVINQMNFGIAEVPVTTIDLQKHVQSFTVKDSTGQNEITKVEKTNDGWKFITGITNESTNGVTTQIEDEKLQGARLEVAYNITANITVHKNFDGKDGVKATITGLVDFIDNNLSYNENLGKNKDNWVLTNREDLLDSFKKASFEDSNGNTKIRTGTVDSDGNKYTTIVKLKDESISKLNNGESIPITLEKVLSSTDSTIDEIITSTVDTYEYNNVVEITGIDYENTKTGVTGNEFVFRDRVRTPETKDTSNSRMIILAGGQYDSATSETISIIPPTGDNNINIIYYVITAVSLVVIAAGAFGIKKFVLKNNK